MTRRLISKEEAVTAKAQHTKPCSDCPWARGSLRGWLGGIPTETWVRIAHSDEVVECHTLTGAQCAGLAVYRRNVCKLPHPPNLVLPKDTETCFSSPMEFTEHHDIFKRG